MKSRLEWSHSIGTPCLNDMSIRARLDTEYSSILKGRHEDALSARMVTAMVTFLAGYALLYVEHAEHHGGTWPVAFYQSLDKTHLERWVPGEGREDVATLLNDYASLRRALAQAPATGTRCPPAPIQVTDLLEAGLLKPRDVVHTKKRPDRCATVVDARFVEYEGKPWRYNDWGMHVTGWSAINIYQQFVLARTGQTLDELRKQLRQGLAHHQGRLNG
jgi:hypothetical protein